ncbi:helix-turn-helix domain-containing protein [Companilactobacillus ginsenosidimutans]|uniref:helix-turn-helix domain-containing protein n=1 Tax=Companilactobacillus ginsenosidimutans TaxID=1007676 RepID=UPI0006610C83|nr:helix-turn-helix transcriptional regulator [Companilactobacillus ginsenosidimutans]
MKISQQLKNQREQHHMSQQELADELHISRQSISKWENETSLPSFANVVAISDLFGISLDELIKKDDDLKMKLEKEKSTSTLLGVFLALIPVAIIIYIALLLIGVDRNVFVNIIQIVGIISFVWLLFTIDWNKLNQALSKKSSILLVIFVAALMIGALPSFFDEMVNGFNTYKPFTGLILLIH